MSSSRRRLQTLDRLIARLERDGPSLALAQASLERGKLLSKLEQIDEAIDQLTRLEALLADIEADEARQLLAQVYLARSQIEEHTAPGLSGAMVRPDQPIDVVAQS